MSSIFLSPGSDPFLHLRAHLSTVPRAHFEGVWATVELQPDPFARQRFTVGVVVADMQGAFFFRLLDDLSKFECLYGRDDVASVHSLMEAAEHDLLRAQREKIALKEMRFEVDAVCLGEFWPTAGATVDEVLNRLYVDVIPLLPREERKARDFVTLDNFAVRRLVDDELKRIAGLDFELIASDPQRAIMDTVTKESHWLEFNLEPKGKAGNVISAVYKTPDRIELNFLRASRDLATYARLRNIREQLAVFVMVPSEESLPASDFDRIENVLGEQSWNLEQQGFLVSSHEAAAPLAQDIWTWSAVAN